jgi:aminoglycoside/choline kinase family phosphotransferase
VYNAAMILEKEVLYFLRNFEVDAKLHEEAARFSRAVELEAPPTVLIHRDFQSRNVMLGPTNQPTVIPAKAGIHLHRALEMDSRFRGNDGFGCGCLANGAYPHLIDWQGARLGPGAYDLASLLNDPYTDIPQNWREDFIRLYLNCVGRGDAEKFRRELLFTGAARLMQNLGAYAKLRREGKDFARWIPPAAARLAEHFTSPVLRDYPLLAASAKRADSL